MYSGELVFKMDMSLDAGKYLKVLLLQIYLKITGIVARQC